MRPVPRVAVSRLNSRHRDDIARHLLQLPAEDRRLRFGHSIPDDTIRAYVNGIDFTRDTVFGIHGPALELIGVAHLALERGEADGRLALDRPTHGGALQEAMADQFALVDSMLKQQYLLVDVVPARERGERTLA